MVGFLVSFGFTTRLFCYKFQLQSLQSVEKNKAQEIDEEALDPNVSKETGRVDESKLKTVVLHHQCQELHKKELGVSRKRRRQKR